MDKPQRFSGGRAPLALGLISLVAGIPIAWVRIVWESRDPYGDPNYAAWELLVLVGAILVSASFAVVGLVLGIKRLVRSEPGRLSAVIGMILSAVVLAGIVLLFVHDVLANQ